MKNRIFKNWKTTVVGLSMMAVGLVLVALGKATMTEYCVFAPLCFSLVFLKDPSFKK